MTRIVSLQGMCLGLLLMLLNLSGCNESGSESNRSQTLDEPPENKPFIIQPEIYGDPDIFDGPRIQFAMQAPSENRETIWSIKTDGTDLRQAVDYELLYGDGSGGFMDPPVRSPDNRYIVLSVSGEGSRIEKQLIDLKTKTKITFAEGGYKPHFSWSADSKEIFFHLERSFLVYHIENKTLTKLKNIGYQGTYYIRGKDQFFVVQEDGFEWFDRQGKSIKKVVLNTKWGLKEWHQLSPSGRLFSYYQRRGLNSYLIDTETPDLIILTSKHRIGKGVFSENEDKIYFYHNGISEFFVKNKEVKTIFVPPDGFYLGARMTLINF